MEKVGSGSGDQPIAICNQRDLQTKITIERDRPRV